MWCGRGAACHLVATPTRWVAYAIGEPLQVTQLSPYQVGSLCHVVGEALSVQRLLPVFEVRTSL